MAPFPIVRMSVLVTSLLSTWIVESSLSSYAGFMVLQLGIVDNQDQVGYSAGILNSALMIGRIVAVYCWGVVADRHGRRPVIFISLWTTAAFAIAFGFSTSFFWALTFRFLLGLLNGLAALSSTLVAEICGKEHEVVGMGVVSAAWSVGVFGGSGLGGMLAEPAIHFPSVFSGSVVFERFPYLLPNVLGASWALLSLPLVLFFLPETLLKDSTDEPVLERLVPAVNPRLSGSIGGEDEPREYVWSPTNTRSTSGSDISDYRSGGSDSDDSTRLPSKGSSAKPKPAIRLIQNATDGVSVPDYGSSWGKLVDSPRFTAETDDPVGRPLEGTKLLAEPRVLFLLLLYGLYMFLSQIENIFSLWALSTIAKGGMDWSTKQIGQVFLACGSLVLMFELVMMRFLLRRFGIETPVRAAMVILVPATALLPSLSSLQGKGDSLALAAVAVLFAIYSCLDLCMTSFFLAINNATVPARRGELNGLASTVSSVAGMVGPAVWSAVFASSIEGTRSFPLDFHLTFYIIAALRLVVAFLGWEMSNVKYHHHHNAIKGGRRRHTDGDRDLERME